MLDARTIGFSKEEIEEFDEYAGKLMDGGMEESTAKDLAEFTIRQKRQDKGIAEILRKEEIEGARAVLSLRQKNDYDGVFDSYKWLIERGLRKTPIDSFEPTEKAQAEAAAYYLDGMVRYTAGAGWLAYDDFTGCYRSDIAETVVSNALQTLAQERYDLRRAENPKECAKYAEKAVTHYGLKQVEGILKRNLYAADKDFDRFYYHVNCRGETYDLYTGQHGPSTPEHFHTKTTGFRPEEGECPVFRKFLNEITMNDPELAAWIMRWFGYNLTGDTGAPYFVNFHGVGRNGKGTLLHVMRQIIGNYAREIDHEIIVDTKRGGNVKNALVNLVGIRAGFAADVPAGSLNLSEIKKITGGDEIVAERKYHDSFTFRPVVKLTFSSNPRIHLSETGQNIKSRLRYIPFRYSAVGHEDTDLENKILKEAPQILAWLIREAGEYLKNPGPKGFPPCGVIDEATDEYIKDEDIIGQFLEEKIIHAPYNHVGAKDLFAEYENWAHKRGDKKTMSNQAFGRKISERDIAKVHNMHGWWYKDIKIRGGNE